jgi:hypothetical protein
MAVHQLDAGNGLFHLLEAPRRPDAFGAEIEARR